MPNEPQRRHDRIYLDHGATTPVDPEVLESMLPYFSDVFGNPSSSVHSHGWEARDAIEIARAQVAALLGCLPEDLVFTSGATEANVTAILGLASSGDAFGQRHVVSSPLEHRSVLSALEVLEERGIEVTLVPPRADGVTHVDDVLAAVRPDTALVSLMWANNETGVLNPIPELGRALRQRFPDVLLHSDATQAVGKVDVDLSEGTVDLLSVSAHKLYGPKGVGALFVRRDVQSSLHPVMTGGGQEGGLRGGTHNVPGIVGFGKACELAAARLTADTEHVGALGRRLHDRIAAAFPALRVNGDAAPRLPGTWSMVFPGTRSETLLKAIGGKVAVSAGSACSAGSTDVSHVLRGMGLGDDDARSTLRFVVGRTNTAEEIDAAADVVIAELPSSVAPASIEPAAPSPLFQLEPIGTVVNDLDEPRYIEWGGRVSRIVLDPRFAPALDGLDGYSHVVVVFWMHHVTASKLTHVPQANFRDVPEVGMFACRCPYRPNPIAVTTTRLLEVDGTELLVEGLDAVNGTPVLDIKPFTPQLDVPDEEIRVPAWVANLVY
jgi:cysteine desulfurase